MIWRLWVQTPLGTFFDEIYFVLCNFRSVLYTNLTDCIRSVCLLRGGGGACFPWSVQVLYNQVLPRRGVPLPRQDQGLLPALLENYDY